MGHPVVIVDAVQSDAEQAALLLSRSGWGPITSATSTADGMDAVARVRPELVVIDVDVDVDSIEFLEHVKGLRNPPAILVLTARCTVGLAVASVRAGARAFVPKGGQPQDFLRAVAAVSSGGGWLPPQLLGDVLAGLQEPTAPTEWELLLRSLTPRERNVLDLMVAGFDRPWIARQLGISLNTVRTHAKNILAKFGVHSSLEAVSVALRAGVRPENVA